MGHLTDEQMDEIGAWYDEMWVDPDRYVSESDYFASDRESDEQVSLCTHDHVQPMYDPSGEVVIGEYCECGWRRC